MFLARRPSRETIDRFLRDVQDLPLSYGPIGIAAAETAGQGVDEAIVVIGRGEADFERAEVMYRIRATSSPQAALARVGQPIVRVLQARFRRHSAAAMKRATRSNGARA